VKCIAAAIVERDPGKKVIVREHPLDHDVVGLEQVVEGRPERKVGSGSDPEREGMVVRRHLMTGCVGMIVAAATLVGTGAGVAASSPAPPAARLVTIAIPAPNQEIAAKWLSYPGPPRADVLLPPGYSSHKHYPLVVFLNGLDFNYASYAKYGLTKPFDHLGAIVVMPEGGNGWYTDWWNNGARADPSWETYALDTVIPTILARYPIQPQRRYHALIGISMGGLGATYLGGRLPGFFGTVATLSGFVDPQYEATVIQPAMALYSSAAANGDTDTDPIYGPPDGVYAGGHNPTLLVKNLASTRLFVSTGTGVPSTADPDPGQEPIGEEHLIYPMSEAYHQALEAAGIAVTFQVHTGAHDIPDFLGEINALLKWGLFKPVVTEPTSWQNETVATSGQLWDFNYRFANPPSHIVEFRQSGTTLSVSAAGSAVTITMGTGCAIHTTTPATVHLPDRTPISPLRPDRVGRAACPR
jgi:S-formylglutathione hydrolase FrmB